MRGFLLPLLAAAAFGSGAEARDVPPPPPGTVLSLVCTAQMPNGGRVEGFYDFDAQWRLLAPAGPAIAQATATADRIAFAMGPMKVSIDRKTGALIWTMGEMGDRPGTCVTRDGKSAPF